MISSSEIFGPKVAKIGPKLHFFGGLMKNQYSLSFLIFNMGLQMHKDLTFNEMIFFFLGGGGVTFFEVFVPEGANMGMK